MPVPVIPKCAISVCLPIPICEVSTEICTPQPPYMIQTEYPWPPPPNPSYCPPRPPPAPSPGIPSQVQIPNYPMPEEPCTGTILTNMTCSTPTGYLLCDGNEVSRTTYAQLFSVIGTYYGEGDNTTTFNVPNLVDQNGTGISYIIKT